MTRYENPCFQDYLSWISYFGLGVVFYFVYANCYLAAGYKSSFLDPFFGALLNSMAQKCLGGLVASLCLMLVGVFVDFFVVKTDFRLIFTSHKISIDRRILKRKCETLLGVSTLSGKSRKSPFFQKFGYLKFIGYYSLDLIHPKEIILEYIQNEEELSTFKYPNLSEDVLIPRVVFNSTEKTDLIGILKYISSFSILIRILSLSTKRVEVNYSFDLSEKQVKMLTYYADLRLLLIRNHENLVIFSKNMLRQYKQRKRIYTLDKEAKYGFDVFCLKLKKNNLQKNRNSVKFFALTQPMAKARLKLNVWLIYFSLTTLKGFTSWSLKEGERRRRQTKILGHACL